MAVQPADLDPRVGGILDLIVRIAGGEFSARGRLEGQGDEFDAITGGLNMLAEEFESMLEERGVTAEALRQSEARYRAYVEGSPFGVFVVDGRGNYVDANTAALRMTGYAREELLSMMILELVPDEERDLIERTFVDLLESGTLTLETRLKRRDGTTFPASLNAVRLSDDRLMAFCGDISARKQDEMSRQRLDARVQRLQKAESLSVLAGGIAHDFNNLLTAVLGSAELLSLRHAAGSKERELTDTILSAGTQARDLSLQMLAYAGRGSVSLAEANLNDVSEDIAQVLRASIPKKVALALELGDGLPDITCDASQVHQVLLNLVTNAAEAIGDAVGAIRVRTGVAEIAAPQVDVAPDGDEIPPGSYVTLEVYDTGPGMDEDVRARALDPFFSTKFTGRGLGLAVVEGIVRGHHGFLRIESEPGQFTRIRVLFPCQPQLDPADVADEKLRTSCEYGDGSLILLVDDEAVVRETCTQMLQHLGYRVVTATDGREALTAVEQQTEQIACVLLDLTMPVMDGREALSELRRIDPRLPVLVASGYPRSDVQAQLGLLENVDFLHKPFQLDALSRKLQALTLSRVAPESRERSSLPLA